MTFAAEIEAVANEPIEAVVIGPFGWGSIDEEPAYREETITRPVKAIRGKVLNWEQARAMLDYVYPSGFGAAECDAIWAYTAKKVIFVSTYDGSTSVESLPRHPVDGVPEMPGGG